MSAKSWDQLLAYEATLGPAFAGVASAVESAPGEWKVKWYIDDCHNDDDSRILLICRAYPLEYESALTYMYSLDML